MDTSSEQLYDFLSRLIIVVTGLVTLGVTWMWHLYYTNDKRPKPRSRFLFVLCYKSSIIMVALWALSWLAIRRLQDEPSLGVLAGLILLAVIMVLAIAPMITIGYLFWLRLLRKRRDGHARPPPFGPED